jgi:hypothetical protein
LGLVSRRSGLLFESNPQFHFGKAAETACRWVYSEVEVFLHAFAKEYVNKGFSGHSSLKEYENKGVAKSTFRDSAKEYHNKGLKRFRPHCGVVFVDLPREANPSSLLIFQPAVKRRAPRPP